MRGREPVVIRLGYHEYQIYDRYALCIQQSVSELLDGCQ